MDSDLVQLADLQDGVFTTAQARAVGVGERSLARLRRTKTVVSLGRSAYVLATHWPDAEDGRFQVRTRAALVLYPDAHPCGASELSLRGIPIFGVRTSRADIVRPVGREVLTSFCRIRESADVVRPAAGECGDDSRVVAAAVVQTAMDHGHVAGVVAADHALHNGLTSEEQIRAVRDGLARWPRASRVDTMLSLVDGRAESVGESRLRIFVRAMGWDVRPQTPIVDALGTFGFADLGVRGTNLLLEFDGRAKYGEDGATVWREKKREDRGRRADYVFERVIWADLHTPKVLKARLDAALERSSPMDWTWEDNGSERRGDDEQPSSRAG